MKSIEVFPGCLKGVVDTPPSKSLCHRAIIAAALAPGESVINNVILSQDILATLDAVQALGAKIKHHNNTLIIEGVTQLTSKNITIDCKESGSTLRFMIPVGLLTNSIITYKGKGNLRNRPLDPYLQLFNEQDIYHSDNVLPIEICGGLKPGIFKLQGDISSQFITGLMFALPLLNGDSTIVISNTLQSEGYIDLTIEVLSHFGISIVNDNYQCFYIQGNQAYHSREYTIEGDYSQAAFWLAAGALGEDVTCLNLRQDSNQGDKEIINILKSAGAKIEFHNQGYKTSYSRLQSFHADVSQCPDLAPILAVIASLSQGTSMITGAGRLRIKECDRLKAITVELNKLGARVQENADSMRITGVEHLSGGAVDSWGDHRIAMALTIAAVKSIHPIIIHNSDVVDKSYPNFYKDFIMLGGRFHERNLG